MSLETEVTKGFLVSLQLLCFYGDLREKKAIKRRRYVHKIGKKGAYRNITCFQNVVQTANIVSDVSRS